MTHRLILCLTTFIFAMASDATMVRVTRIQPDATIIVDAGGTEQAIRLAGVTVTDPGSTLDLLRWTIDGYWVKIEADPSGGHLIWRSPDALFVNREVVLRGFATATQPGIRPEPRPIVTYLGVIDPPHAAQPSKPAAPPKVKPTPAPRSDSGTNRRPPKRRSPGAKPRSAKESG